MMPTTMALPRLVMSLIILLWSIPLATASLECSTGGIWASIPFFGGDVHPHEDQSQWFRKNEHSSPACPKNRIQTELGIPGVSAKTIAKSIQEAKMDFVTEDLLRSGRIIWGNQQGQKRKDHSTIHTKQSKDRSKAPIASKVTKTSSQKLA